jgi:ribosomal-protein-alanine N-acetyltransferase
MPSLKIVPITAEFVREILSWRYEPPYDFYNFMIAPEDIDKEIAYFLAPENRFRQVMRDGMPIAGFSLGLDGQVPGGDYRAAALDIGLGIRPDLTGQGFGGEIVQAIVDFAIRLDAPPALRVTIAAFNERALRVWTKAGFREVSRFIAEETTVPFVILIRDVE